jgi:hypothetical protein
MAGIFVKESHNAQKDLLLLLLQEEGKGGKCVCKKR